ncbi:hypothetical protein [Maridesulfovibrio sp. FT414]|uniref:hypothetical protein n=1 Tax=Maridesulfovibrio sp. FT414 TaxID=2979469 RepID=UPI003D803A0B
MKYICKKNCYVRNPQGGLQYFRESEVVDYAEASAVPEHFEPLGGSRDSGNGQPEAGKSEAAEKETLRARLKELGINCPVNAGLETLRRKIREAEGL